MIIAEISWVPLRLLFRAPLKTSRGLLFSRETLLIKVKTDIGLEGIGEASWHPFSSRGLGGLIGALQALVPGLIGKDIESLIKEGLLYKILGFGVPQVSFAIEIALLDALGKEKGLSIGCLLGQQKRESIEVNALIAPESANGAALEARSAKEAGFSCVKLKIGASESLKDDLGRLAAVREAVGPDVKIRLDANGAWGVDEATLAIRVLEPFGVELIEQPVAAYDLEGLKIVKDSSGIPVAADESIKGVPSARRIIELQAADILVLKPPILGGIVRALKVASMAQAAGMKVYATSSLDSSVGVAAALQLASMLPEGGPACGLATAELFTHDTVLNPPRASGGLMRLPKALGLGVELDNQALERLRA